MKEIEAWCGEYCKRYKKNWELTVTAGDSWLNGFYKAREEFIKIFPELKELVLEIGQSEVTKEFNNGEHQLK